VLKGLDATRARDVIRQVCEKSNVDIIRGNLRKDHIHLLISCPPYISISKLIQYIKGNSSKKLQSEFPQIRKDYWGKHFWSVGYFCATVGNVNEETIENYIQNKDDEELDDPFTTGF